MLTDTHAHVDAYVNDRSLKARLDEACAAGVSRIIATGGKPDANRAALTAARMEPLRVRAALGLDRDCADSPDVAERIAELRQQLADPAVVAVGEVGLDFHYHPDTAPAQCALFRHMTQLARDVPCPLVIHSREAEKDTLEVLRDHAAACRDPERLGVLHCFTGGPAFARSLLDVGMYISFSGILTFRNAASIRAAAAIVPEDRLLLETDTPYLAPVPHRGKPNSPALLVHVADTLAQIRGWTREETARITTRNAERLFYRHWTGVAYETGHRD